MIYTMLKQYGTRAWEVVLKMIMPQCSLFLSFHSRTSPWQKQFSAMQRKNTIKTCCSIFVILEPHQAENIISKQYLKYHSLFFDCSTYIQCTMEFLRTLHRKLMEWNSFANDDDDENIDDHGSHQVQADHHIHEQKLREQRVSTRIYAVLLNGKSSICQHPWWHRIFVLAILIILVLFALAQERTTTVTVKEPSMVQYQQLQAIYATTLSCPCSTVTIPYDTFSSVEFRMHQICTSIFISDDWIAALYTPDASHYLPTDFRSTGSAQVY